MNIKLERPLIIFDLEATGISPATDRIVEISMLKIQPDGTQESKTLVINPTIPIPLQASEIHGIYDKDVADKPTFERAAPEILEFIGDSDLGGYNSARYDVPMLVEEFLRAGIPFNTDKRQHIDVMRIFMKKEQRTLEAALHFYCGKELVNAHSAQADVQATWDVLEAQLRRYEDLPEDVSSLNNFCLDGNFVDLARRMYFDEDGIEYFNFGKNKGRTVQEVLNKDPQYYDWIMKSDFPRETKYQLEELWKKYRT